MEEVVTDETQEQGTEVQEPEVGVQENVEEVVTLPSDVEEFTMPDKFAGKSAEEIAKSYMELEKFKGAKDAGTEPTEEAASTEPEGGKKGTDYLKEYQESGGLSDESYKELAEKGIDKAEADDRMEFEAYKSKKSVDELVSVIGGVEEFTAMEEWAKGALEETKISEYAQELAKASKYGKQAILKDLYSQYKGSQGGDEISSDVVHTNQAQTVVTKGYASQHELQADMSDKRYGTDRSYTQAVEAKLSKSKDFS